MEILNSLCNFTLFFLFGTFCCFRSVHTQEFTCEAHNDYQNYIANSVCEIPVAIGGFYPIAVPNFVTQSNELMQAYFNPTFDECFALLSEFGLTNKTAAMLNPTCNTAIVRFCCYWNLRKCFSQSGGQINLPYSVCRSECLLAQQACGVIFTYSDGSNLNLLYCDSSIFYDDSGMAINSQCTGLGVHIFFLNHYLFILLAILFYII